MNETKSSAGRDGVVNNRVFFNELSSFCKATESEFDSKTSTMTHNLSMSHGPVTAA